MQIRGSVDLPASQTAVWQFLATPDQISQCVPNLVSWQTQTPNLCYQLLVQWPLTPQQHLAIPITLEWLKQAKPNHLQLKLTAQLQQQLVHAYTHLTLIPTAAHQTQLDFKIDIDSPNRFTGHLIKNAAPKAIDAFFKSFKSQLQSKNRENPIADGATV